MGYFDDYIKGGSPSQQKKSQACKTAIGLQDVDGLKTSEYLIENARKNIEGDITINEVRSLIDDYYQSKALRNDSAARTEEADKVSVRITSKGVNSTSVYLERFFENLLFGTHYELRNREMSIANLGAQSVISETSKGRFGTLDVTLEECAVLGFLNKHPRATQLEIAGHIGKSTRTVKRLTVSLAKKGILKRENGKRYGVWIVVEPVE